MEKAGWNVVENPVPIPALGGVQSVAPVKWKPLSETPLMDRVDALVKRAQHVEKMVQEKALVQLEGLGRLLTLMEIKEENDAQVTAYVKGQLRKRDGDDNGC